MIVGYVLIVTNPTKEKDVLKALAKIERVEESYGLFGEYDIIVKVRAKDYNDLGKVVLKRIRSIPGVLDTETLSGVKLRSH